MLLVKIDLRRVVSAQSPQPLAAPPRCGFLVTVDEKPDASSPPSMRVGQARWISSQAWPAAGVVSAHGGEEQGTRDIIPGQCARLRTRRHVPDRAGAFSIACIPIPFPAQSNSGPDHGPKEIDSKPVTSRRSPSHSVGTDAYAWDHTRGEMSRLAPTAPICGVQPRETHTTQAAARSGRMAAAAAAHPGKALSADLAMQQCPGNEQAPSRRRTVK